MAWQPVEFGNNFHWFPFFLFDATRFNRLLSLSGTDLLVVEFSSSTEVLDAEVSSYIG